MNKVYLGIIALVACACVCVGQTDGKQRPASKDKARSVQTSLESGTTINAELQKAIDVNRTQVGNTVVLKTTQSVKQNGDVVIPKGANLIGRITEVQRRSKENALSRIGIVFDSLRDKRFSMPLTATIVSISNVGARSQIDDSIITETSTGSRTTTSSSSGAGTAGLLGSVTGTVGSVVNATTHTAGAVTSTAGNTLGRTLSGIQISTSATGSANGSTTLSSSDKNLRVEKGATFHVRVAN